MTCGGESGAGSVGPPTYPDTERRGHECPCHGAHELSIWYLNPSAAAREIRYSSGGDQVKQRLGAPDQKYDDDLVSQRRWQANVCCAVSRKPVWHPSRFLQRRRRTALHLGWARHGAERLRLPRRASVAKRRES